MAMEREQWGGEGSGSELFHKTHTLIYYIFAEGPYYCNDTVENSVGNVNGKMGGGHP